MSWAMTAMNPGKKYGTSNWHDMSRVVSSFRMDEADRARRELRVGGSIPLLAWLVDSNAIFAETGGIACNVNSP